MMCKTYHLLKVMSSFDIPLIRIIVVGLILSNSVISEGSTSCDLGFWRVGDKCYFYGNFKVNWYTALEFCHALDRRASLASLESEQEMRAMKRILARRGDPDTGVWIGGSDHGHHGTWTWLPTGRKVVYFDWAPGQPDALDGDQHCLYMIGGPLHYVWGDFHCDFAMHFLCETHIQEQFRSKTTSNTTLSAAQSGPSDTRPSPDHKDDHDNDDYDSHSFSPSTFLERLLRRKLLMAAPQNSILKEQSYRDGVIFYENNDDHQNNEDDSSSDERKNESVRAFQRLLTTLTAMRRIT